MGVILGCTIHGHTNCGGRKIAACSPLTHRLGPESNPLSSTVLQENFLRMNACPGTGDNGNRGGLVVTKTSSASEAFDQGGVANSCLVRGLLARCRMYPVKGGAGFFRSRSPLSIQGSGAEALEEISGRGGAASSIGAHYI